MFIFIDIKHFCPQMKRQFDITGDNLNQLQHIQDAKTTITIEPREQINDSRSDDQHHSNNQECCGFFSYLKKFLGLYKYTTETDRIKLAFGVFFGLISGLSYPGFVYLWGLQITEFVNIHSTPEDKVWVSFRYFWYFFAIGFISLLIDTASFTIWTWISETLGVRCRQKFIQSLLSQQVGWHERQNQYQISSKFKVSALDFQKATGDKIALLLNLFGMIIGGLVCCLTRRWTYSLFLFALVPVVGLILFVFLKMIVQKKLYTVEKYKDSDTVSVEAANMIKTVKMHNGQDFQKKRYLDKLKDLQTENGKFTRKGAILTGLYYSSQYLLFGIGFYYGTHCVKGSDVCPVQVTGSHYQIGDIIIVFFEIFICSFSLMQLASNLQAIKNGIKAGEELDQIISISKADSNKDEQRVYKQPDIQRLGEIKFEHVFFKYPANPNKIILNDLTCQFTPNGFNGIAGLTGSGKSTVVQILMKYFQDFDGLVTIGGVDIKQINRQWLRGHIGYVGQEPSLFSGTIKQNILVGRLTTQRQESQAEIQAEIWTVLRKVNMYQFVKEVTLNYDVGPGGCKLSGGQKQRIAIARALIRKPKILILDEATSALDRTSEKKIQRTINKLAEINEDQITIICIAHRVKTIRNAKKIFIFDGGRIKEEGFFNQIEMFRQYWDKPVSQVLGEENQDDQQKENPLVVFKEQQKPKYQGKIYSQLLKYTQNIHLFVIMIIASIIAGISHPSAAFILTYAFDKMASIYIQGVSTDWCNQLFVTASVCSQQLSDFHNQANKFYYIEIGFSVFIFLPFCIQSYCFSKLGDQITSNLRQKVYHKLLRLPVSWFDRKENSGGAAASRFGIDTREVSGLVTGYIGLMISNICCVSLALVYCYYFNWQLGILSMFIIPLIVISGYISMLFFGGYEDKALSIYDQSGKLADEIIINYKTIYAFNYQQSIITKYKKALDLPRSQAFKKGLKIGALFGVSMFIMMISFGSIYLGAAVIYRDNKESISVHDMLVPLIVAIWAGWYTGNSFFFMPNSSSGKQSAANLFNILAEKDEDQLQNNPQNTLKIDKDKIRGQIQVRNLSFSYMVNGVMKKVLNSISLKIKSGQKVAFVGASGCGKSTLVNLIMGFYQYEGQILLDGINIRDFDIHQYRDCFAIVNQEPSLFVGTLEQNVRYNKTSDKLSSEEILRAALRSCARDLSDKQLTEQQATKAFLSRKVGAKGTMISGGEKQRIAVARAVVRRPQILILDEGTSALDRGTEKIVQEFVDEVMRKKTSINIAHRIQTIQNADVIFVFDQGRIIEEGNYNYLLQKKGHFYQLLQGKSVDLEFEEVDLISIQSLCSQFYHSNEFQWLSGKNKRDENQISGFRTPAASNTQWPKLGKS